MLIVALLCTGCRSDTPQPEAESPAKTVTTEHESGSPDPYQAKARPKTRRRLAEATAGLLTRSGPGRHRSADMATQQVLSAVQDTLRLGPTLVVWIFDSSPSSQARVREVSSRLNDFYSQLPSTTPDAALHTAMMAVGQDIDDILVEPTTDSERVLPLLKSLPNDTSGRETIFEAVKSALERYLPWHVQRRARVMIVVVTDEAGDDWQLVDQLIVQPQRYALPIYVIGSPAPLGRMAALPVTTEAALDAAVTAEWAPIRQGPESRYAERLELQVWGGNFQTELLDSGFGPFALEWLCRASGGAFLAVRPEVDGAVLATPSSSPWPSAAAIQFDPQVMARYAPDYVSEAEYQVLLAGNRACQALYHAAGLAAVDALAYPQTEFRFSSEAELNRRLTDAQQAAAMLEPKVNAVYEILREGERDRPQLARPRWQAEYDLAMGRILSAKSRIDGYNTMLAALKRGRRFQQPESTRWVLEPADAFEGSSTLQNLADRAREYLQRVVEQHRGTPWAYLAEEELKSPLGWRWKEAE